MKIVSWNCNGALRKKFQQLAAFDADVYVVQECENPRQSKDSQYKAWAENSLWVGNSPHKGLGVFSRKVDLAKLDWESNGLELFLPCSINNRIKLLAVWTRQANSPTFAYIGQAWKYLQAHKAKLTEENTLLVGDFNSNACWDKWDRWWNHSDVVKELSEIGIHSTFHFCHQEQHGSESQPTFFMYRKVDKPYHIDYAFASSSILKSSRIEIGKADQWLEFSDHMPIMLEFDSPT